MASTAVTPQQIAGAMKNAIAFSGLFYESHVAQWAIGKRPRSDLLNEPLAKRGSLSASPTNSQPLDGSSELDKMVASFRAWAGDRATPGPLRDRKSAVEGRSESVRVYFGGRRIIKKKK